MGVTTIPTRQGNGEDACIIKATHECKVCTSLGINVNNYSKKYRGLIKFKSQEVPFEVHHIDVNRDNNCASNLVLIPRELHKEFHSTLWRTGNLKYWIDFETHLEKYKNQMEEMRKEIWRKVAKVNFEVIGEAYSVFNFVNNYTMGLRQLETMQEEKVDFDEIFNKIQAYKLEQKKIFDCQRLTLQNI